MRSHPRARSASKGRLQPQDPLPTHPKQPGSFSTTWGTAGARGSPPGESSSPGPQKTRLGRALSPRPSLCCQSPALAPSASSLSLTPPARTWAQRRPRTPAMAAPIPTPTCPGASPCLFVPVPSFFFKSHKSKGISLSSRQGLVGLVFRGQVGGKERAQPLCDAWPPRMPHCGLSRPPRPQTSKLAHPSSACHSGPQLTTHQLGGKPPVPGWWASLPRPAPVYR